MSLLTKKIYISKDTYFLLPPFPLSDAGMEHITMNSKSKQATPTIKLYQQNPLRKVICKEKNQRVHCISTTGRIRIAGLYVQMCNL